MWAKPTKKDLKSIPALYSTEGVKTGDKIVHGHFFVGYENELGLYHRVQDLENKNRFLQESVTRLQEACSQYETDLDEARNLAEIYKEERDESLAITEFNLEQARQEARDLRSEVSRLRDSRKRMAKMIFDLKKIISAQEYRAKIQVATGPEGVVSVDVNGDVVIKINFK